jgi:hypothetical protein
MAITGCSLRVMRALFITLFCLAPVFSGGQPVGTPAVLTPPNPTSIQTVAATFSLTGCPVLSESTTVAGATVTTVMSASSCVIATPAPTQWTERIGVLPAGVYTYEVYVRYDQSNTLTLLSRQVFVVTQALTQVPALSLFHLLMLWIVLSCISIVMMRQIV